MRTVTVAERRARLARRHHLSPPDRTGSVVEVARDLVGLHATDPASVFLAARARLRAPTVEDIGAALYDDRAVVRMLGMRRTMWVVPDEAVPVVHAACGRDLAIQQRKLLLQMVEDSGVASDPARWLARVEKATLRALDGGEATAGELSAAVPALKTQLKAGLGTKWETVIGAAPRVLLVLAVEGKVVRGRPRGSWISSQYRWAPMSSWIAGDVEALSTDAARVDLAGRWLRAFGPGTVADLKWWTGLTVGQVRKAAAALDTVEVDLDGRPGLVLAGDEDPEPVAPAPSVALLPALDPTVMGWKERTWYLGDHGPALFDRNGNAGPTVWVDGRVVGGWAQDAAATVVFRILEDVGAEASAAVTDEADRLTAWMAGVRVTPRFRTPLERELSAA